MRDEVFKKSLEKQFEFDESVASVFDDMINRSVPYYQISSELIVKILLKRLKSGDLVYDLGCSTGAMLMRLAKENSSLNLVGIDNSSHMLDLAKAKAKGYGYDIKFQKADILNAEINPANAVVLNYTLQFIRPLLREKFLKKLYENLKNGSTFIMSEKIIYEDSKFSKDMIEIYEEHKISNGYSEFEVAQKRKALENVLVPFSESENKTMLKNAGFSVVETIFKWGNFASFLAIK